MIKVISKKYSQALKVLCEKLDDKSAAYDLILSPSLASSAVYLKGAVDSGCQAVILVGNVSEYVELFGSTFGVCLFYDKYAEKIVAEFCKLTKSDLPPRHVMDKICLIPEAFNHLSAANGYQCACFGVYGRCHVYIIPADAKECVNVFDNYISGDLLKGNADGHRYCFKLFGLSQKDAGARLARLNPIVSKTCDTTNLDSKIVLNFPQRCAKSVIADTLEMFRKMFAEYIYATTDQSLAKTVVSVLMKLDKRLSVAESITGGMISSSLVDVAGASNVFFEGAVTYATQAKCKRLGISPHFVDEYGVVSAEVAKEMVSGLLADKATDIAVSTTGYAGPSSDPGYPVGLCYIGVGSEKGISAYRYVFVGDRNSVRAQACNAALFAVYKTIVR